MYKKLSIIIPVFNEEKTIATLLQRIADTELIGNLEKEILIVDDGSIDNTLEEIKKFSSVNTNCTYFSFQKNQGKGSSIRHAIQYLTGDLVVIQDGDLEYEPSEFNLMLEPFLKGEADAVYGSRFIGGRPTRKLYFAHNIGNRFLTFLCNLFNNLNLTDMECCYKMFKTNILQNMDLKENRFGFEPEVTAKLSKIEAIRIYEIGVSYYGRTYKDGKKIGWRDGLRAIYVIIRYGIFK